MVGAGPVGSLAALYAAARGDQVEVYELRGGTSRFLLFPEPPCQKNHHARKSERTRRRKEQPEQYMWRHATKDICQYCPLNRAKSVNLAGSLTAIRHRWISRCTPVANGEILRESKNNVLCSVDLRDPATVPLNFTKSINLALSERGINSLTQLDRPGLIENVLRDTIPMYGRMIHGRDHGALWEAAQAYDVHGRVGCISACRLHRR